MSGQVEVITRALEILRSNGVVGMPTETVYGLAADARSSDAVAKIFALKGRPSTNPLIVHVASVEIGERYAVFDDRARKLFETFAPGALTVVLPLQRQIVLQRRTVLERRTVLGPKGRCGDTPALVDGVLSPLVSAGLDTVGIRIPNHPVALELLRAFDGPLAAPSANKSNHISPTMAQHVRDEFGPELLVLDGGPCRVGIESTVLDCSREEPVILRPGEITRRMIETIIGPVSLFHGHVDAAEPAISPGQQRVHYAPRAKAYRIESISGSRELLNRYSRVGLITLAAIDVAHPQCEVRSIGTSPDEAATRFYAALREIDATSPDAIFIELPPDRAEWWALRDRMLRATQSVETMEPRRTT